MNPYEAPKNNEWENGFAEGRGSLFKFVRLNTLLLGLNLVLSIYLGFRLSERVFIVEVIAIFVILIHHIKNWYR